MTLFLGTDAVLHTTEFSKADPGFYVGVPQEHERVVRRHFSAPRVYYVGSHTACGCGFGFGTAYADGSVDSEEAESRRRLGAFLRTLVDAGHTAEVYLCWTGEEKAPVEHRGRTRPEALLNPDALAERHHLIVTDTP